MYLVGAPHRHKADAQRLLEDAIAAGERLASNAEVLQEILHRYMAIARREAIQPAFDALLGVVDDVFAIELADAERAKAIVYGHPGYPLATRFISLRRASTTGSILSRA